MSPTPPGPRKVLRWFRKRLLPPSPAVKTPFMLARDLIAEADQARDRREWEAAAQAYGAALTHQPDDVPIRIQQGHMLKEAGRLAEADDAYRAASQAAPLDAEPWLLRAHVLKTLGRNEEASDAFVEALRRDSRALGARDELISIGARHRLPRPSFGSGPVMEGAGFIGRSLNQALSALGDWVQVSTYPIDAYDAFRRAYPVAPPPTGPSIAPVVVVVDASDATPAALSRTMDGLLNQTHNHWTALVRSDAALRTHPVASLQSIDPRIVFVDQDEDTVRQGLAKRREAAVLSIPAGAVLGPEAMAWFLTAAQRTGAAAVYADHDYHEDHWRLGPLHQQPAFQSMPDAEDWGTNPRPPVTVLLRPDPAAAVMDALVAQTESAGRGRALLLAGHAAGTVAHLPRLLTSVWIGSPADGVAAPLEDPSPTDPNERILVVIPTRDQAALLAACVDSLQTCADRPGALDLLIVDNRSVEDETRALLAELATRSNVEVMMMDEPFNWARLNTLATRGRPQPLIVFANNDIEAIGSGWDAAVRRGLSGPDVGVVGARLLYADRSLQHGGIVLGAAEGRPMHEGVGAGPLEDGPMGRYRRTRPVAAITGAFMGVRRETFERLGGFDDRLAIGYNDIDFCLKARAAGLKVVYSAELSLVHHESKTRGLNDSADKIAWDETELKRLHDRWGEALFRDPGVNPHWSAASGRPLDGYRDPTLKQVLSWLDQSVRRKPWEIRHPQTDDDGTGLTVVLGRRN